MELLRPRHGLRRLAQRSGLGLAQRKEETAATHRMMVKIVAARARAEAAMGRAGEGLLLEEESDSEGQQPVHIAGNLNLPSEIEPG